MVGAEDLLDQVIRRVSAKTKDLARIVPLWPQLEEILHAYVFGGSAPKAGGLLFPSPRTGEMVHDFRKALDAIATRGGWAEGAIRSRIG